MQLQPDAALLPLARAVAPAFDLTPAALGEQFKLDGSSPVLKALTSAPGCLPVEGG